MCLYELLDSSLIIKRSPCSSGGHGPMGESGDVAENSRVRRRKVDNINSAGASCREKT